MVVVTSVYCGDPVAAGWKVPMLDIAGAGCDVEDDDPCTTCAGESCCAEIEACDGDCILAYETYYECLILPDGAWSGFSSVYCRDRAGIDRTNARPLVDCFDRCAHDDACGLEPIAAFEPPANDHTAFSAAGFLEAYCNGCHFLGSFPELSAQLSTFTIDTSWTGPFADPRWLALVDYDVAVTRAPIILCGVHPDSLPDECFAVPGVEPGFFGKAEKFPPPGSTTITDYGGGTVPVQCSFAADGFSCPQPSRFERARMVSWIVGGTPRH